MRHVASLQLCGDAVWRIPQRCDTVCVNTCSRCHCGILVAEYCDSTPTPNNLFFPLPNQKNGWFTIYLVSGSMYGVAAILYMLGVSATEVEWNMYEEIQDTDHSTTKRKVGQKM